MKKTKILLVLTMIIMIIFAISPIVGATINPEDWEPNGPNAGDVKKVADIVNPIIGTIKVGGIVIAFITLMVLGIKYMTGSISEKADYKKTMIPYLIGAILVVAITQLLGVLVKIIAGIE